MKVRMAEHLGMCFGVRDAIDLALQLAGKEPVTILGDLVHNPDVVADLEAAGAVRARHRTQVQSHTVLLTAHGTANRVKLELLQAGHEVHDAACPLVTRVHHVLARLISEGRHPVIIGQANHVEVRGLVGDLDEYSVVLNEADLDCLAGKKRLGVVAQTTQPIQHVRNMVAAMRLRFPEVDLRFVDTVCQPTKDRQDALQQLALEVDVIVVVGGPESNNSRKLVELARRLGCRAYQVAGAAELRESWFAESELVGLTAGTSTPDHVVEEVRQKLESIHSAKLPAFA